jgi:hypothetical protein
MMNLLRRLTALRGGGAARGPRAVNVAGVSGEHKQVLEILWWRWRKLFLESKRLELQVRQEEGR